MALRGNKISTETNTAHAFEKRIAQIVVYFDKGLKFLQRLKAEVGNGWSKLVCSLGARQRSGARASGIVAGLFLAMLGAQTALAEQVFTVPFDDGFIGKDNGSPNTAVQTYTFGGVPGVVGGITRAYFSQNLTDAATEFQSCNGAAFL